MPYRDAVRYWKAITVLDARERLVEITVSTYPHSKQNSRNKVHKELEKRAYPRHLKQELDFEEAAKRLGNLNG